MPKGMLWAITSTSCLAFASPADALAQTSVEQESVAAQASSLAASTAPDNGSGDIIVTARRKAENLLTVPVAVTAVNGATLNRNGSFSPLDIAQIAPGIRTTGLVGSRSDIVYSIRGQSITYGTVFPAVIPYFADIPIVAEFSTGSYFDLDNIQILRGPQGVRFGRVTDGGAVLVQPKKPTNDFEGYGKVTLGDYSLFTAEGAVNVPIVDDKILLRVAGERNRRAGFTTNGLNGQKLDDTHYQTIRGSLLLRPLEGVENITVAQYNTANEANSNALAAFNPTRYNAAEIAILNNTLAFQQARGPRHVLNGSSLLGPDNGLFNRRKQLIVSNTTTINITDNIRFKNIAGYLRTKKRTGFDYDGSPLSQIDSYGELAPRVNSQQLSEEAQISGNSLQIVDWTIGSYFDEQKPAGPQEAVTFIDRPTATGTAGTPSTFSSLSLPTTRSRAVYGQAEVDLSSVAKGLKVNGGARYTHDTNSTRANAGRFAAFNTFTDAAYIHGQCNPEQPCTTFKSDFNVVTWEVGASYALNSDAFTYVSYRRGYRPGGTSALLSTISPTGAFKPEYDKSLEIGLKLKGRIADMPFRTNIALFYDRYTNIQKLLTYVDPVTTANVTQILNVDFPATIKGIEFEGSLNPTRSIDLSLNAAFTDAKYSKRGANRAVLFNPVDGACNRDAPTNNGFCPFNRFNATPKFQTTASVGYTLPLAESVGDVRLGFEVFYQSSQAFADYSVLTPDVVQKGYTVINANLNWRRVAGKNLDLAVFVSNLTNKVYWQGAQSVTQSSSAGVGAHFYAPPRMFGASAMVHLGS